MGPSNGEIRVDTVVDSLKSSSVRERTAGIASKSFLKKRARHSANGQI